MKTNAVINILATLVLVTACQPADRQPVADLVLTNGYIYTVDGSKSVAEAVAISGNMITFVGSSENAAAYVGENTEVRDLGGAMVMPGIHDMHVHALGTIESDKCDLNSGRFSLEEMVPVLRACLDEREIAPGHWLIVLQWAFSSGNAPSDDLPNIRAALDAVSAEHPIFLWGDDGHHAAANSAALATAKNASGETIGINAATLRDEFAFYLPMINVDENGEPTGGINEDARTLLRGDPFADFVGMDGDASDKMPRLAARMAQSGITSLQDAIVTPSTLAMYGWLEESGGMTFRFRAAMAEPRSENIEDIDAHLDMLKALREQYSDSELVSANAVKLFADAVLEGNPLTSPPTLPVAALLENFKQPIFGGSIEDGTFDVVGYIDQGRESCQAVQADPGAYTSRDRITQFQSEYGFYPIQCIPKSGILEHEEAFTRAYIRKATEAGFHVHVHALSDKAVRIAVDEFGKVKNIADASGLTQSLAHVQLAHPDDQKRIGELGISVVFTFVWTASGPQYEMMVAPFIDELAGVADLYNPDHYYMKNVYPAKSIQDFGGILVNGSDAPVGGRDPMPLVSLAMALYRSDGEAVLNEKERIDVHSAIEAFTINGAKLMGHDDKVGSIETGKLADLVVLSQNIVDLAQNGEPYKIAETKVTTTIFNGKIVYEQQE
ncbi:MAG: amidohydrolase family protein [Proteobacteria bacterium]|nr:amidohydrolase family protein [Pseudomonadota bacterium]MDA0994827.1 amidohydrolase family protein [Pseudomonadota bacterium]